MRGTRIDMPTDFGGATAPTNRRSRALSLAFATFALTALLLSSPARADFGIAPGSFDVQAIDRNAAGDPVAVDQSGAHPDEIVTRFDLTTRVNSLGEREIEEDPRNIEVELPAGFAGDPTVLPRCTVAEMSDGPLAALCGGRHSAQVGFVELGNARDDTFNDPLPIYNMVPPAGVPARFSFRAFGALVNLDASVRTGSDYGITVSVENAPSLGVAEFRTTFWGRPADPELDDERGLCPPPVRPGDPTNCPSDAPLKPFLTMPTRCSDTPLRTHIRIESWNGNFDSAFSDSHLPDDPTTPNVDESATPVGLSGCELLDFKPSMRVQPTSTRPDSPTGLDVELKLPQNEDPDGRATAHLKKAVVTLPEGMTVNPSSADGLQACSSEQIGLDNDRRPTCPEASKIGTVEVDTPLLDDPLTGHVFVAKQTDNPFRSLLAIYIVAEGPGVVVKLPGHVDPDPVTGRLETTFDNNPQLPFTSFRVRFKGGPRAPLANPPTCGMKVVETEMTPWSGTPPVHPSDTFNIDCPGITGFAPSLRAGTINRTAGGYSPMVVRINRADGQEYLQGLSLETPPGLIANLRGVPLCSDADANAGACPAESKIGTAIVGAGAGSQPFFTAPEHGSVYLTEGYKGAPYGLSSVTRAIAGPYDLGTVVVRQAVFVDPVDAHLTVVSDPLPVILEGIPLRLRSINVDVNRPNFTLNPTSCSEKLIRATLLSTNGSSHQATERFQAADCQALRLRPRLSMRLTGRRQTHDGGHPGLRSVLVQGAGQANMKRVRVKLPLSLALDPENAQSDALCEFEAGKRADCPASSIIGRARAFTPVLNRPLEGPVYFVKNVRVHPRTGRLIRTLPTLLITLRGEVAIDLRATSDVIGQKLVSTFPTVPDAPTSRFELNLNGGPRGILTVTGDRNLCARPRSHIADIEIDGQNGKRADQAVRIKTPCAKRRAARLRVRSARWRGRRLTVSGRISRLARRPVRVTARCAGTRVSRRARPRAGRWRATLRLPARCARTRRARLTATYPGGGSLRRATAARPLTR
jgi:hypothetical protein